MPFVFLYLNKFIICGINATTEPIESEVAKITPPIFKPSEDGSVELEEFPYSDDSIT